MFSKMISFAIFASSFFSGMAVGTANGQWAERPQQVGWRQATAADYQSVQKERAPQSGESDWRKFSQTARSIAAPMAPYVAPLRDGLRQVDHAERAAQAVAQLGGNRYQDEPAPQLKKRDEAQPRPAETRKVCSALDPSCLQQENKRLNNPDLPTLAVIQPLTMEQMNGYYGGYRGYSPFYMGGFNYPAWGSQNPAGELANYVQQQLTVQYRNDGRWNVLIAATGQQADILPGMDAELRTGRGIPNENGERTDNRDWNTAHYSVAASVGIVEEDVRNLSIDGGRLAQLAGSLGANKSQRLNRLIWDTLGTYQRQQSDRVVVGILHVVIVDNTTRTVIGSYEGITAISYQDFVATTAIGIGTASTKYPGAWKFARDLVHAALLTPIDEDAANQRHIEKRQNSRDRVSDRPRRRY